MPLIKLNEQRTGLDAWTHAHSARDWLAEKDPIIHYELHCFQIKENTPDKLVALADPSRKTASMILKEVGYGTFRIEKLIKANTWTLICTRLHILSKNKEVITPYSWYANIPDTMLATEFRLCVS